MISLNISTCKGFKEHRSGWSYCISCLKPFHSNSGIFIDGFLDQTFARRFDVTLPDVPFKEPWIGFLHNPPNAPEWFDNFATPQSIIKRESFRQSLKLCKCIVVLSNYMKDWLVDRVKVPVISVKHPTQTYSLKWSPEKFFSKQRPKIVQIGYWLRKIHSILDLQNPYPYKKVWLPGNDYASEIVKRIQACDELMPEENKYKWSAVKKLERLTNQEYDDLLTSSVVFLDLYDSSANNAVVEAIARNTPLLINRLPAVVEYCGKDYPLYFDDLEHAAELLKDTNKIIDAHYHFKNMNKKWIGGSYFARDLIKKLENII